MRLSHEGPTLAGAGIETGIGHDLVDADKARDITQLSTDGGGNHGADPWQV
jgi:hypothetical protein